MAIVEYEQDGHVTTIMMNRSDRLNAVGTEMHNALARAWQRFMDDSNARVAILTGTGRAFCAGRDIKEQAERDGRTGPNPERIAGVLGFWFVPDTTKPIIAAVNGGAYGLGWYMVCGSDIAVASESAVSAMSELPTGIIGPAFLPIMNQIPWLPASEIVLRGHTISAQRAYELGLVNYVVPADDVLPRAKAIAEELAALPPLHVQKTKEMLMMSRPRPNTYTQTIAWPQAMQYLGKLEDTREAAMAFAQKRKPAFQGR